MSFIKGNIDVVITFIAIGFLIYVMVYDQERVMWTKYDLVSSAISSVEYSGQDSGGRLRVHFTDGTIKTYGFVTQKTVDNLLSSSSQGRYFNEFIRDQHPVV